MAPERIAVPPVVLVRAPLPVNMAEMVPPWSPKLVAVSLPVVPVTVPPATCRAPTD